MADDGATKEEVLAFVKALNETWTKGDGSALSDYFHPRMVAITATDQDILYGRNACLASWQSFARAAQIHRWEELEPDVKLHGDTAIVTYYYDMSFDMDGETFDMGGRDMFVLVKENGRWWAVADQFSAFPEN
jgi:ketosteroid isomerase-like protein